MELVSSGAVLMLPCYFKPRGPKFAYQAVKKVYGTAFWPELARKGYSVPFLRLRAPQVPNRGRSRDGHLSCGIPFASPRILEVKRADPDREYPPAPADAAV